MRDFDALGRYLRRRYSPLRRAASVWVKRLLPVRLLATAAVTPDAADVLLLHPHPGAARRHEALAAALTARGLTVRHAYVPRVAGALRSRQLHSPHGGWDGIPREWRFQAAHAAWLCERFRPRVLVTFMDDSLHTPFLRDAAAARGGVLVNVAHAMCWPTVDFSMCDVDWLLLWGKRSFDNMARAPLRFGSCRTLAIGSIYQRDGGHAVRPDRARKRVLWIGQDLRSIHRDALVRDASSFARFARDHPEYDVTLRSHPLDDGELRRLLGNALPGARWGDVSIALSAALADVDIAVSSFSSGLVDAAARGIPVIAFSTSGLAVTIGLHDHGLPIVSDAAGLASAVACVFEDYARHAAAAKALAGEHLVGLDDATPRCCDVIAALSRGSDPATLGFAAGSLEHKEPWPAS